VSGMSRKDLRSALDALNAQLDPEFGAALETWDLERGSWSPAGPYVPEYVCELRLAPDGYGRDRVLLRGASSPDQDEARRLAWEDLRRLAGLPDASSGEELALKLSLLPDRDVRRSMRLMAFEGDGVSREDMLGALRAYDELFDFLGFDVRLKPAEFGTPGGRYACAVTARYADSPTSRLLWRGSGATPWDAREDMLRLAHSESGMPLAFSEEEAKMRIAAAGEEAFRPACRRVEMFAGAFEGRW